MCSIITLRTVLGPPCISWPFVIGVAGADTGVVEFCEPVVVVVNAWAACNAACADAFWKRKGKYV